MNELDWIAEGLLRATRCDHGGCAADWHNALLPSGLASICAKDLYNSRCEYPAANRIVEILAPTARFSILS